MDLPLTMSRLSEMRQLRDWLGLAINGQPQLIFLSGEAGAGKSHLLEAFAQQALTDYPQLIVAQGLCNAQFGQGDPLLPFRAIAATLFSEEYQGKRSEAATNLAKNARSFLWEIAPDAIEVFLPPLAFAFKIAQAFGVARSGLEHRPSPAEIDLQSRAMAFEEFCRLLFRAAQDAPLLLFLEDLHWADESTVELLFHLARSWKNQRICIVGAYRPSEIATSQSEYPLQRIQRELMRYGVGKQLELANLSQEAVRDWIGRLFPSQRLPDTFSSWLYTRSGGSPLFIRELLRDIEERGWLIQDASGVWILTQNLDNINALPASISAVLEQRLARLEYRLRDLLLFACVEGRTFSAQVLAHVAQTDVESVLRTLNETLGQRMRLIQAREDTYVGKGRLLSSFEFEHAAMRDHLYASLEPGRRRFLHRRVAEALEQLYEGMEGEIASALAQHYTEAQNTAKSFHYSVRAAQRAAKMFDYRAVRRTIGQATSVIDSAQPSIVEQVEAWYLQGRAEIFTGSFALGERCYRSALDLAQAHGLEEQRADLLSDLGYCYLETDRSALAVRVLKEAAQINQRLNNQSQAAHNLLYLSSALARSQRVDIALRMLDQTMQRFKQLQDSSGIALAHHYLGIWQRNSGNFEQSLAHLQEAVRLHIEIGDRFWEASDYTNLGSLFLMLKNDDRQAMIYYRRALELCHRISKISEEGHVKLNIARLFAFRNDWNRARVYVDDGIRIAEIVEEKASVIRGYLYRGIIRFHQGQRTDALSDYGHLLRIGVDDYHVRWGFLYNLGSIQRALGKIEEALRSYTEAANLVLGLMNQHTPEQRESFLRVRRSYYVFAALRELAIRTGRASLAESFLQQLPPQVLPDLNEQPLPRFHWGARVWTQ